ncbi:hypothetical protein H920_06345 [Fukomys damarensis]|uniref:Uncharacterized protein n=1 Tax=Fukomys damarensis TaxID=885580 RepID=A0A091DMF5_FUKDA|nr:hypothetical protein H920_06345 [Fukomys damarensis]
MTGFLPPSLGRARSIYGNRSCKFGILPSEGPQTLSPTGRHRTDRQWRGCKVDEYPGRPGSGAAQLARGQGCVPEAFVSGTPRPAQPPLIPTARSPGKRVPGAQRRKGAGQGSGSRSRPLTNPHQQAEPHPPPALQKALPCSHQIPRGSRSLPPSPPQPPALQIWNPSAKPTLAPGRKSLPRCSLPPPAPGRQNVTRAECGSPREK